MSKIEDKNIIFYSLHPRDDDSKKFMELLAKNEGLDKQFIKICVYPNFRNVQIPDLIKQINKVPVLIASGFDKPIIGKDALSWIQNNPFNNDKVDGLDYADISNSTFSSQFASLQDDSSAGNSLQQFYQNDNYNAGFGEGVDRSQTGNAFASVDNNNHIQTFSDSGSKKGMSDMMKKKMSQLQWQRNKDVPQQRGPGGPGGPGADPFGTGNAFGAAGSGPGGSGGDFGFGGADRQQQGRGGFPNPGWAQQGGSAQQGGFPQQGFQQQGGFSQQGGFQPQQGGFQQQGGFPQQGGFQPQQGGFQPQQGQGQGGFPNPGWVQSQQPSQRPNQQPHQQQSGSGFPNPGFGEDPGFKPQFMQDRGNGGQGHHQALPTVPQGLPGGPGMNPMLHGGSRQPPPMQSSNGQPEYTNQFARGMGPAGAASSGFGHSRFNPQQRHAAVQMNNDNYRQMASQAQNYNANMGRDNLPLVPPGLR